MRSRKARAWTVHAMLSRGVLRLDSGGLDSPRVVAYLGLEEVEPLDGVLEPRLVPDSLALVAPVLCGRQLFVHGDNVTDVYLI